MPYPASEPASGRAAFRIERGLLPKDLIGEATATLGDLLSVCLGDDKGDLDGKVDRLAAKDRRALSSVYDAFRETAAFQSLIHAAPLRQAAINMTGAKRLHVPFQHAVFRLDMAGEHWRGFAWHQDYPYNMLSQSYVTAWMPLTPTGPWNGSIEIAPDMSDRIHPVDIRYKRDVEGNRLKTRDAFITDRLQPVFETCSETLTLDPGDVVLFDNRLVHRSGYNPGPRHRYSVQARFGDLLAPEMIERGWANRRADGFDTFKTLHPSLVETEEMPKETQ